MAKPDIHSYGGQILRIDLNGMKISKDLTSKYARQWLGGSGLNQWLLYNEVKPWITPYAPANRLIFGAGPLVGTLAPGASRMSADSINALTLGVGSSNSDSHFGPALKFAGYDHIIIQGKSRKPVYIWIDDDRIEIKDACHLWGKTTWKTVDMIRHELSDDNIHLVSIGPAGENICRSACIIQDKGRAFGRCGLGSIMGSKHLKAIAVRGTGAVEVAHPQRFMRMVDTLRQRFARSDAEGIQQIGTLGVLFGGQASAGIAYKNSQDLTLPPEVFKRLAPGEIVRRYRVRNINYMSCPLACSRYYQVDEGPYAGLKTEAFQYEALAGFSGKCAVEDPSFLIKINALCNQLGLDVDGVSIPIAWAMECYQKGILTENDTDGLRLNWGDTALILELTRKIANRDGFGNILAEGCAKAADMIGKNSRQFAMHIKGQDLYEQCRGNIGWALGCCTSTRGGGHTTGAPLPGPILLEDEEAAPMLKVYGKPEAEATYADKAEHVAFFEKLQRINNSFGICLFCSPGFEPLAELYSAATGWETTVADLKRTAARILNVEKAFNILHAGFSRMDDYPPPRDMQEPIPSGPKKGLKMNKEKWDRTLDRYYQINGWEIQTGFPTRPGLEQLDLKDIADDLNQAGRLGHACPDYP